MSENATPEATEQTPPEPDLSEQFADLGKRFDQVLDRLPEPDPAPPVTDPAVLMDPPGYEDDDDFEDDDAQYGDPGYGEPQTDPRLDALEAWAIQREHRDAVQGLQALGNKHPELREPETLEKVRAELDKITDDPATRANPRFVEAVYLGLKAEAEASSKDFAEEAGPTGAALETNASGGAPTEFDPEQAFVDAFGSGREESIF